MKNVTITSKQLAFIAVMCTLANVFGFFAIPLSLTCIHLMQLPIFSQDYPLVHGMVG